MVSARLRAWGLAGDTMLLVAAGPGETDVEIEARGSGGRYARPCGGHQDLATAGIRAALEAPLPGEADHAVLVEGWAESGAVRDRGEDGSVSDWGSLGGVSLAMGYSRRWGELTTGVAIVGQDVTTLAGLQLQPIPTARLRVGPKERVYWTAELAPDLRAIADYALRTDLHFRLPQNLWGQAGFTAAGTVLPQPVLGLSWQHANGFGVRVGGARTLVEDEWWFLQAGITFNGTVRR